MAFTRGENQYSTGRPIKWITLCWEASLGKVHGVTGCENWLFSGYSSGRLTCWILVLSCCVPLWPLVKAIATSSSQGINREETSPQNRNCLPTGSLSSLRGKSPPLLTSSWAVYLWQWPPSSVDIRFQLLWTSNVEVNASYSPGTSRLFIPDETTEGSSLIDWATSGSPVSAMYRQLLPDYLTPIIYVCLLNIHLYIHFINSTPLKNPDGQSITCHLIGIALWTLHCFNPDKTW